MSRRPLVLCLCLLFPGVGRPDAARAAEVVKSAGVVAVTADAVAPGGRPAAKLSFEQAGAGDAFVWIEVPVKGSAQPDARAVTCAFSARISPAAARLSCALVGEDGAVWVARDRVVLPGARWAQARFPLPRFAREGAPGGPLSPERVARIRVGFLWSGPARGELLLRDVAWTAAPNRPPVPATLGRGTGGEGAWAAEGAAHSPTSLLLDEGAGPEGTPAAVISLDFAPGKYNYEWATVATGHLDTGGYAAVRFTYRTEVPAEFPPMNVMVRESGGATYWVPEALPLSPGRFRTVTLPWSRFAVPAWSSDANGKLDEDRTLAVGLGFATGACGKGRVFVSDLVLVPPGY